MPVKISTLALRPSTFGRRGAPGEWIKRLNLLQHPIQVFDLLFTVELARVSGTKITHRRERQQKHQRFLGEFIFVLVTREFWGNPNKSNIWLIQLINIFCYS